MNSENGQWNLWYYSRWTSFSCAQCPAAGTICIISSSAMLPAHSAFEWILDLADTTRSPENYCSCSLLNREGCSAWEGHDKTRILLTLLPETTEMSTFPVAHDSSKLPVSCYYFTHERHNPLPDKWEEDSMPSLQVRLSNKEWANTTSECFANHSKREHINNCVMCEKK